MDMIERDRLDMARAQLALMGVDYSEMPDNADAAFALVMKLGRAGRDVLHGGPTAFRGGPSEKMGGLPLPDQRPVLHAGDVTATLFNEFGTIFRRIQMADAFEKKVTEAAKSPAAWLLLREELNGGKDVTP